jgi:hypothetical protein
MYDAYAGVINDLTNLPPHMPSLPQPSIGASVKAAQLNQNYFPAKKLFCGVCCLNFCQSTSLLICRIEDISYGSH